MMNLIQEGMKLQQAIVDANAKAAAEQEKRDRLRSKHEQRNKKPPKINGSVAWHDSGTWRQDFHMMSATYPCTYCGGLIRSSRIPAMPDLSDA